MENSTQTLRLMFNHLFGIYLDTGATTARRRYYHQLLSLPDLCVALWDCEDPMPRGYYPDMRHLCTHQYNAWVRRGGTYADAARFVYSLLNPAWMNVGGVWCSPFYKTQPISNPQKDEPHAFCHSESVSD